MFIKTTTIATCLLCLGSAALIAQEVDEEIVVEDDYPFRQAIESMLWQYENSQALWDYLTQAGPQIIPPPIRAPEPTPTAPPRGPCPRLNWIQGENIMEGNELLDQIESIQENGITINEGGTHGEGRGVKYAPGSRLAQGVLEELQEHFTDVEKSFEETERALDEAGCQGEGEPGSPRGALEL